MKRVDDFSDERLKAWCIHCGVSVNETISNWDHVPSKSLLNRPLPPHVPQVFICKECNSSFSLDEEYFVALMSCILTGNTDPTLQINKAVGQSFDVLHDENGRTMVDDYFQVFEVKGMPLVVVKLRAVHHA